MPLACSWRKGSWPPLPDESGRPPPPPPPLVKMGLLCTIVASMFIKWMCASCPGGSILAAVDLSLPAYNIKSRQCAGSLCLGSLNDPACPA